MTDETPTWLIWLAAILAAAVIAGAFISGQQPVSGTIVSQDHKPASEIGTFWGVIEEKARWWVVVDGGTNTVCYLSEDRWNQVRVGQHIEC